MFGVQTDPAGTYSAWKANAIGGTNSNNMREFLEKNWADNMDEAAAKKLCMKVSPFSAPVVVAAVLLLLLLLPAAARENR